MNRNQPFTDSLNHLQIFYPELVSQMEELVRLQRENQISNYQFDEIDEQSCLAYQQILHEKKWIHGPQPPLNQSQQWIDDSIHSTSTTVIVWKSGLGYVPRLLHELNPNRNIIICENRLELLWESLCRWDNQCLFKENSRLLVTDDDLFSSLTTLIQQYPLLFTNKTIVIPGSVFDEDEQAELKRIQERIRQSSNTKTAFPKTKSLCIMSRSLTNIFPAVCRGAEQLGYSSKIAKRTPALSGLVQNQTVWKETCGCVPEIALAFYNSFFQPHELEDMKQNGVKRVCWIYDRMYDLTQSTGNQYDLALTFDRKHVEYLLPIFGDRARFLPAATGMNHIEILRKITPPTPITFVGATGLRRSLSYINQNRSLTMQVMGIINRVIGSSWYLSPQELQDQLFVETKPLAPSNDELFKRFVLQLAASRLRVSFLSAAQSFGLTVYGDGLWGKREFSGNLISSYAGNSLDYKTETPDVYAASSININLFHPQIFEGVPMRVYDVLACGGFLLSQYRPVLEEQFTIGEDLDVFHTPNELAEKINYYLQHVDERKAIAQHGQQTVLQHHTYSHRLQKIVDWLHE